MAQVGTAQVGTAQMGTDQVRIRAVGNDQTPNQLASSQAAWSGFTLSVTATRCYAAHRFYGSGFISGLTALLSFQLILRERCL